MAGKFGSFALDSGGGTAYFRGAPGPIMTFLPLIFLLELAMPAFAEEPAATAVSAAAPTLASVLGTKADGFVPPTLQTLHRGMSPAEVAALYPGADKLPSYGIVTVKVANIPNVASLTFHYLKDKETQEQKLHSVGLNIDPKRADEAAWKELVDAAVAKWGPQKAEDIARHLCTWVGAYNTPDSGGMVQMHKDISNPWWTVDVTFPKTP